MAVLKARTKAFDAEDEHGDERERLAKQSRALMDEKRRYVDAAERLKDERRHLDVSTVRSTENRAEDQGRAQRILPSSARGRARCSPTSTARLANPRHSHDVA